MYTDYFSLTEKPFSITPDPAYLFLSRRHEEALAHLLYGVTDSGGFIQLTGEVGTGKTTVIRSLFERIPEHVEIALILNPRLSENEFLHAICDELLIPITKESTNKECFDALNNYLLDAHSQGKKIVLLIDEAQNLEVSVLEYIRLLTNLETDKDKLLQIILVGQPELQTLLQRQDLRQLAQRITARYHLLPLNIAEARAYIAHRLTIAKSEHEIFTTGAKNKIYSAAKGIPRLINVLCDRALLGAYSQEKRMVDSKLASQVIKEVLGNHTAVKQTPQFRKFILPIMAFAVGGLVFSNLISGSNITKNIKSFFKASDSNSLSTQVNSPSSNIELAQIKNTTSTSTQNESIANKNVEQKQKLQIQNLAMVLSENISNTTAEKSILKLLELWGKPTKINFDDVCRNVTDIKLRCLYRNAQWSDIVRVNRPLIIEIHDDQNTIHHLLIKHADSESVLAAIADREVKISLKEILMAWRGDYLLFWEPLKNSLDTSLQFGSKGEDVKLLKEQLELLKISPKTNKSNSNFGGVTMLQVKNFQKKYNLIVDGVAGSETFIAINNALDLKDRPKLMFDHQQDGVN